MLKSFVQIIYVFVLVVWAVEKSECKQGAACLSYGHSCWGGHGKRNAADMPDDPNAWFLYRMALMRKSADRDSAAEDRRHRSRDRDAPPNYFDALEAYVRKNQDDNDGDGGEAMDASWIFRPGRKLDVPSDYRYDDDRMLDARTTEYKFVVNSENEDHVIPMYCN